MTSDFRMEFKAACGRGKQAISSCQRDLRPALDDRKDMDIAAVIP